MDIEKWEDLTISNDFIFAKLMTDKEICKEIIENLLHIKIKATHKNKRHKIYTRTKNYKYKI